MAGLTLKGRRTRKLLLESARVIFGEKGFVGTRVEDISKAAGVSYGTFYTYFKNKEDIFETLLEMAIGEILEGVKSVWTRENARKGVREVMRVFLKIYGKHSNLMASERYLSATNPRFEKIYSEMRGELFEMIKQEIEFSGVHGICRKIDPRIASLALGSMLEQFAYSWKVEGILLDNDKVLEVLTDLWYSALEYHE